MKTYNVIDQLDLLDEESNSRMCYMAYTANC